MNTTLILFALGAALMTFLGGIFSLRFRDQAHLITSFSAGVVLGLAFFDLLPESLELFSAGVYGFESTKVVTIVIAIGFIFYLVLDRMFNTVSEKNNHDHSHESHIEHGHRGVLRATSLVVHSFLDGVGIGFAFQVSTSLGILVAVAVLAHDFSDGINTITAILKSGGEKIKLKSKAIKFLLLDSIAPIFGIAFTLFFTVSENILGLILALFCGFFFYIGASDLIPESYHNHPTKLTTFMTILGMLFILIAISFAQ
jgi:ZIP family zinc transporter